MYHINFIHWRAFSGFRVLATVIKATMNIGVHVSFQIRGFVFSEHIPRSEFTGRWVHFKMSQSIATIICNLGLYCIIFVLFSPLLYLCDSTAAVHICCVPGHRIIPFVQICPVFSWLWASIHADFLRVKSLSSSLHIENPFIFSSFLV